MNPGSQRHLFDIPPDVTYLNCAYMSPQLRAVTEAGMAAVRRKSSPWEVQAADFFRESDELRALFREVTGADAEGVALIPSVSYGIGTAAANLTIGPGRSVITLEGQFPSNVYPWRAFVARHGGEVRIVGRPGANDWTSPVLDAIDDRTAVVAVPNCHWTDGSLLDLEAVGERAREVGAALVVDASQSLGARPLDFAAVRPDFVIAVGYKWLLGPYSLGYLWVAPQHRDGRPVEETWMGREDAEDFAGLVDYRDGYQPGARRFDMGERSNFTLVPMALAALRQLAQWGVDEIAATLGEVTAVIEDRATAMGLDPVPAPHRAAHLVGVRIPGGVPKALPNRLAEHRVYVSVRGDSIRLSPHLYTSLDDIDRLFDILATVLA